MSRSSGSDTSIYYRRSRDSSISNDSRTSYRSDTKRVRRHSFAKYKRVDRISELPESIILHIFSFLPVEDAVRSGILSKQFAYLWTNLSSLEFVYSNVEFIDKTLFLHNRSNLQKFSITSEYCPDFDSYLDGWIRLLFRYCPVKDLTLKFKQSSYRLPQHFYWNSSIIKLNLLGCEIRTEGRINWESLQSLTLSNTNLPDSRLTGILSGCPSMEFLELSGCEGFTNIFPINNKCLKKLVIRDYEEIDVTLKIFAPHLQSFVLSGTMYNVKCKVFNADSLINCCLDFSLYHFNIAKDKEISMLTSLLEDVRHVKDVITIGDWGIRVLSLMEKNGLPFPLFNSKVKCLKLDTKLSAAVMDGIKCLLRGLNCLEKLSITKSGVLSFRAGNPCLEFMDMETDLDLMLKTVEISGFSAWDTMIGSSALEEPQHWKAQVLLVARFLLKNSSFLEEMTIIFADKLKRCESLLVELLNMPRSSPRAVVRVLQRLTETS